MAAKQPTRPVYDLVQTLRMWRRPDGGALYLPPDLTDDIIGELERLYELEETAAIDPVAGMVNGSDLPERMRP